MALTRETSMAERIRWRLMVRGTSIASALYFVLLVLAAASARITGGKELALLAWIGATLVLLVWLMRLARQAAALSAPVIRGVVAVVAIAAGVSAAAFFGFVVMVNVWEILGLGH